MVAKDTLKNLGHGDSALAARTDQKQARVSSWRELTHVRKVKIERDEESSLGHDALPDNRIKGTTQALLSDPIRRVAGLTQQLDMASAEVLIQLDQDGTHRSGTNSSSRANSAA